MIAHLLGGKAVADLARELARLLFYVLAVAGLWWIVSDLYYDKGYAARSAEIARATAETNAKLVSEEEADARLRSAADLAREEGRQQALAELAARQAEDASRPSSPPPATVAGPSCAPVPACGLPPTVRAKLNTIR